VGNELFKNIWKLLSIWVTCRNPGLTQALLQGLICFSSGYAFASSLSIDVTMVLQEGNHSDVGRVC
jgi:hypothetical protein